MKVFVTVLVALGIALVVAVGAAGRIDAYGVVILVLIGAVGALAFAVARKSESGRVQPALCGECGGLVSPHAPVCKHCGAALSTSGL